MAFSVLNDMNLRRKDMVSTSSPTEYSGEVTIQEMEDFDISKTIFRTVNPEMVPLIKKSYALEYIWSDQAIARVESQIAQMLTENSSIAQLKGPDMELIKFMQEECRFDCEHADGSFLDHLYFCYTYGSVHMPSHSAVPLFIHSIFGVGTNLFPMKLAQRPQLAKLVTAEELLHTEAFPTVLRLLISRVLLDDLLSMTGSDLANVESLECYRILGPDVDHDGKMGESDNAPIILNREQMWVQLNYQLIHLLEFLPATQWEEKFHVGLWSHFIDLHQFLNRTGKLFAKIDFESEKWMKSLEVAKTNPQVMQDFEKKKNQTKEFCDKIGHRLEYEMKFKSKKPKVGL